MFGRKVIATGRWPFLSCGSRDFVHGGAAAETLNRFQICLASLQDVVVYRWRVCLLVSFFEDPQSDRHISTRTVRRPPRMHDAAVCP